MLRLFIGEWIGGTAWPLKRFSDDLEPFGLSRDAVLSIYNVIIKATIVTAYVAVMDGFAMRCNVWNVGVTGWVAAGLNLWACLKAIV
jgi:hypothetical protein